MATRNFETREGFDFWDRLCKIPRYAFLLSKAGNSVQKAEGLGNWIDRDEAMVVMDDAQSEINVLRQDCATMIAELEDLRTSLKQIVEQYPNPDLSHVDYRVHACRCAEQALAETLSHP